MNAIRKVAWLLVVVALIAGAGVVVSRTFRPPPRVTAHQSAQAMVKSEFELVDHRGNRVNQADFAGQWQLVFFGFTFCPDICPTTLATIAQVLDSLGARTDRLTPLFITVDPERDTPEVLAEYVAAFHPRIVGLTGTPEQVRAAARSFRIYHGRQADEHAPDGYVMSHSGYIYLMDPKGRYEAVFTEKRDSAEQIAAAINRRLGDD